MTSARRSPVKRGSFLISCKMSSWMFAMSRWSLMFRSNSCLDCRFRTPDSENPVERVDALALARERYSIRFSNEISNGLLASWNCTSAAAR
jgi:hypothetical protein